MGQFVLAAVIALDHARDLQFKMGATHSFAGFGSPPKRYCHVAYTSFEWYCVSLKVALEIMGRLGAIPSKMEPRPCHPGCIFNLR